MADMPKRGVQGINISSEMRTSFLDYAMSVIVSRALPDVRDGLKPVHRRILYAMQDLGNTADKPHKNPRVLSATSSGNIIRMVIALCTIRWSGWHKISTIAICSSMATGTSGP